MATNHLISSGRDVGIRRIGRDDLARIVEHPFSVSVTEPLGDLARLTELFDESGLWTDVTAAVAVVESETDRMVGTLQCYRCGPCIHGLEIGYLMHSPDDRGRGYASQAARLFSDHLFATRDSIYRHQLIIEVWNTASWKVAERAGFVREGILRSCGFGDGDPADCFVYSRTAKDHHQQAASADGPTVA